jgi:hypothetical protein
MVAGATLGILPVLGSFVTSRLLLPASIGFAVLFSNACCGWITAIKNGSFRARSVVLVGLTLCVFYVHGYRAFIQSRATTEFFSLIARSRTLWPLTATLDDTKAGTQQLVMIAAADANDAPHLPFIRHALGHPLLRGFRLLSGDPGAHEIRRINDKTLDVRVLDPSALPGSVRGSLTRAESDPVAVGQTFKVAGLSVTVLEEREGQPVLMRCRFDVPLEDASLAFVHSTPQGLVPLLLPAVGASAQLPPPIMPDLRWLPPQAAPRR